MNNGFGINFLRFVCEEDDRNWSQVFARLPFDDIELKQKGALFGVVRGNKSESWADVQVEMTNWVEEFFNKEDTGGNLGGLFENFKMTYEGFDCVWVWIFWENEIRKIRMIGNGGGRLLVLRKGSTIELSEKINDGKVLAGEVKPGDQYCFWVGDLGSDVESWKDLGENSEGRDSFSALKITAGEVDLKIDLKEELVVETEEIKPENDLGEVAEEVETVILQPIKETGLASNKYVGKLNGIQKIKNWFASRRRGRVEVGDNSVVKKNKISALVGVVFLILLIVSLVLGGARKKAEIAEKDWLNFSQPIENSLNEAVGLAKLNAAGSKRMVEEARSKLESNKQLFVNGSHKGDVEKLTKKIEEVWVTVSGEKNGNLVEVVNLDLIRSGVNANRLSFVSGGKFIVTSSGSGIVMSVDTDNKDVKVVAGKGAGLGWIDAVSDGDKTFVMNKGGVFVVGNEASSLSFDTAITDPLSLARFGTSAYVLEKGNKEIFKFLVNDSGFGERTRWLKENQLMSVIPLDMDIDVDIWVLGESGQIERFRRGVKEGFNFGGISGDTSFEKITVEKDGDRIALLNSKLGAVVFCSKATGLCDKQVKTEKLKEAKDIEFDGKNQLMVLLPGLIGMLN